VATDNEALLTKLDGYFRSAQDHPSWSETNGWRGHAATCFRYREGEQWTAAELRELEKRGQPPTVNNQIKVTVDRLVGQFVLQRQAIAYSGRNPVDEPVAEVLTDVFRFIRQNNNLEFEERECAEDGFVGGFGVLSAYVTFDDTFQPEIKVRALDPFEIFPDPHSRRYDWNDDAQFICHAKWLAFEEAAALYPDQATALLNMADTVQAGVSDALRNTNYIDFDSQGRPRRLRIVECWYKVRERQTLLLTTGDDGQPLTIDAASVPRSRLRVLRARGREIERVQNRVNRAVFTSHLLLSHTVNPHDSDLFPYVPFFVQRRKNGEPYSLIWTALTMQDAINKRESKALHLLNTNQALIGENTVRDKDEFASELARPDGIMEVRGDPRNVVLSRNVELAQGQLLMHQEAKGDFRRVTGVNPDAMGERSEVRSGIGIARKQAMTDMVLTPAFHNFSRTRSLLARLVLALVQRFFTEQKVFAIRDDMGATRQVVLGTDMIARAKQSIYDVVVKEQPDSTTMQEQQQQMLLQALPQILPFGAPWVEMLVQMSELRHKDELLERIRAMQAPPPPEPKISVSLQWAALTTEEKIAWAGQWKMPALAQAQMMNPQPTDAARRAESDQGYQQMEMARQGMEMDQDREMQGMKMAELAIKMRKTNGRDEGTENPPR